MKILQTIFSVKNDRIHKIITILGFKIKFKSKGLILQDELQLLYKQYELLHNKILCIEQNQNKNYSFKEKIDESITITEELTSANHFNYKTINIHPYCKIQKDVNIGKCTYIQSFSIIDLGVTIGKYCSISNNVFIGATMHQQNWGSTSPFIYDPVLKPNSSNKNWLIYEKTEIGNDVWIGSHVVIKTGVKIGNGAIIGSGAIVTKDVPPYAIVVGVPGKVIRYRFSEEIINKLTKLEWWNLPYQKIINLPFDKVEELIKELENEIGNDNRTKFV